VVLYSTIIDSLCKDRLVTEALNMLSEMMSKGIQPDLVTYNSLIQGLCNFGRWKEATTLFKEMEQRKILPNLCKPLAYWWTHFAKKGC
jgi:pentatricopeptide repeat protein